MLESASRPMSRHASNPATPSAMPQTLDVINPPASYTSAGAAEPMFPDHYADQLLDEVFSEVEHILETGAAPLPEPKPADFVVLKPLSVPKVDLLTNEIPKTSRPASETAVSASKTKQKQQATKWPSRSEKFLLGAVVVAFGTAASLWIATRDRYQPVWAWLTGQPPVAVGTADLVATSSIPEVNEADLEFASYLQKSLVVLQTEAETLNVALRGGQVAANGNLPAPVGMPGLNSFPTGQNAPTVLERVYIPIYRDSPVGTSLANLPPIVDPTVTNLPAIPVPANPTGSSVPPTAISPAPASPTAAATLPSTPTSLSPSAPVASLHTLVGILELGDRSAALFEINGVTRRFNLGETIGSSGWALVEVANQEALVRRNGEVRSIYVGQSF